jgi:hypothetical protein
VKRFLVLLSTVFFITGLTATLAAAFPEYYSPNTLSQAQAEARQRNLPLAWVGSNPAFLTVGAPDSGSAADLTQMAMDTLRGNAVIVFFDGRSMTLVPDIVHAQYHLHDDGKAAGNADWVSPKVVFSNPDVTKILGRVSYTQMKDERDIPLNSMLQIIRNDPSALTSAPIPAAASGPAPAAAPGVGPVIVKAYGPSANQSDGSATFAVLALKLINAYGPFLAVGALVMMTLLVVWFVSARRR